MAGSSRRLPTSTPSSTWSGSSHTTAERSTTTSATSDAARSCAGTSTNSAAPGSCYERGSTRPVASPLASQRGIGRSRREAGPPLAARPLYPHRTWNTQAEGPRRAIPGNLIVRDHGVAASAELLSKQSHNSSPRFSAASPGSTSRSRSTCRTR